MVDYKDYYKALGVGKTVTADEIKKAYKKLARKYYSDTDADSSQAEEKFKEVGEAYEVLKDQQKRQRYDQFDSQYYGMRKIKKYETWFYENLNKYIYFRLFKKDLNKKTFLQFIRHYLVGFIGTVLNYLGFNLLMIIGLRIEVSNIITFIILVIISFFLQKYFTYRIKYSSLWQPILFLVNAIVYYVLDTAVLLLLIDNLLISPWISKIVSIIVLSPLSFIFQKYVVFRRFKVKNVR